MPDAWQSRGLERLATGASFRCSTADQLARVDVHVREANTPADLERGEQAAGSDPGLIPAAPSSA